jgi:hypothetical protein
MKSQRPAEVSDLLVEQLLLGELSREDEQVLRAQLAPEELERRLEALRGADAAFRAEHDHDQMVSAIAARARIAKVRSEVSKPHPVRYLVPSLAVLALMVWFARPQPGGEEGRPPELPPEIIIEKGIAPHMVLYRRHGEQVEMLTDGARAGAGDMLQLGYVAAQARYGAIVSVDGSGTVTLHFPDAETASTKLTVEGGEQLLGHSYELDAAPAFERFFFVTAAQPLDVKKVMEAAHSLARSPERARRDKLSLSPALEQTALTLVKE